MKIKVNSLTDVKGMLSHPYGLVLTAEMSEGQVFDLMVDFFSLKNGGTDHARWERWMKIWEPE